MSPKSLKSKPGIFFYFHIFHAFFQLLVFVIILFVSRMIIFFIRRVRGFGRTLVVLIVSLITITDYFRDRCLFRPFDWDFDLPYQVTQAYSSFGLLFFLDYQ